MKGSIVAVLGVFVVLALINNVQGGGKGGKRGKGGKGRGMGRCEGMKFSEEDKALREKCKSQNKDPAQEGTDGEEGGEGGWKRKGGKGGKGWGKKRGKVALCMMKEKEILKDGKLDLSKYNEATDKMFDTPEASQKVKDAFKKCCDEGQLAEKTFSTDEDFAPLMKCSFKAKRAGCKNKGKKGGDEGKQEGDQGQQGDDAQGEPEPQPEDEGEQGPL